MQPYTPISPPRIATGLLLFGHAHTCCLFARLSLARYSFLYYHQRSDWFVNERWSEIYGATGPPKPRAFVNDKEVQDGALGKLPRSSAQACAGAPDPVPAGVRKSQSQEDEHLLSFFGGFCGGTYLELGALDGITYSNTYAFNKALGWKGVLIELSPTTFAKLRANRPNELAVVNAVVCKEEGIVHYVDNPKGQAVNGIWELASPKFRNFWWRGKTIDDTTPVQCRPLRNILGEVSDAERDGRFFACSIPPRDRMPAFICGHVSP